MFRIRRLLKWLFLLTIVVGVLGASALGILVWMVAPTLPSVQTLRDVEYQVPLSVHSADGKLMAVFGETRRTPVDIATVPQHVKQAFIATEDARFYEHPGVDWRGVTRAVWLLATTDDKRVPGGSTITQQVARAFFLSSEYSYTRKFAEMLLALKMERELSKDEILGLYLNKSFFGNRAYGIVAAAEFYYGKTMDQLTLTDAAMLASIPKHPSTGNPIINPVRALERRNYVLQRMFEEGFIDEAAMKTAQAEPDRSFPHEPPIELEASYVAEMVRQRAMDRYGADALTGGYRIYTTIDSRAQDAANSALRNGLATYDRRHGWRGPQAHVELSDDATPSEWQQALSAYRPIAGLTPALVTMVDRLQASLALSDGQEAVLELDSMKWAAKYISAGARGPAPRQVGDVLKRGDIVWLSRDAEGTWQLAQIPQAQGALVSISPEDGAIVAMAGGFSFGLNKFNRATQALRQPGSSFKPFVYAAAFERGFTPASIVLDAPVVFHDKGSGNTWRPANDNNTFAGPMRLREAMVTSRNLVSVRVLDAIGPSYARRYIQGFGFTPESLPENLSLALGTSSVPPLALARGYTAFVNGGYLVDPYFISRIVDRRGVTVMQEHPLRACHKCPERLTRQLLEQQAVPVADSGFALGNPDADNTMQEEMGPPSVFLAPHPVDARTAFLIHSLLRDVVKRGTGRAALVLEREDIGGKTGSTNEHRDAWFSGFGGNLVTTVWVGMDDFTTLGDGEYGGRAALPVWIDYMRMALEGVPQVQPEMPNGIVTALIDPATGQLAAPGTGAISELFKAEDVARLGYSTGGSREKTEQEAFDIF